MVRLRLRACVCQVLGAYSLGCEGLHAARTRHLASSHASLTGHFKAACLAAGVDPSRDAPQSLAAKVSMSMLARTGHGVCMGGRGTG